MEYEMSDGNKVLVDLEDINMLQQHAWRLDTKYTPNRAVTNVRGVTIYMHRFVLGVAPTFSDSRVVVHLDKNYVNNQKSNLEVRASWSKPKRSVQVLDNLEEQV